PGAGGPARFRIAPSSLHRRVARGADRRRGSSRLRGPRRSPLPTRRRTSRGDARPALRGRSRGDAALPGRCLAGAPPRIGREKPGPLMSGPPGRAPSFFSLRRLAFSLPVIFLLHVAEEAPRFVAWFNSLVARGITQPLFLTVNTVAFVITL